MGSCPKTQIFLYNLTTCQQTCRSLSEADSHCVKGFAPVDGCGCPDHTFLDEKGRCVPQAKCSCYHRGSYVEAGDVVLRQEERWWVSWAGEGQGGQGHPRGPHIPARTGSSLSPTSAHSVCRNGRLHCTQVKLLGQSKWAPPPRGPCPRAAPSPAPPPSPCS